MALPCANSRFLTRKTDPPFHSFATALNSLTLERHVVFAKNRMSVQPLIQQFTAAEGAAKVAAKALGVAPIPADAPLVQTLKARDSVIVTEVAGTGATTSPALHADLSIRVVLIEERKRSADTRSKLKKAEKAVLSSGSGAAPAAASVSEEVDSAVAETPASPGLWQIWFRSWTGWYQSYMDGDSLAFRYRAVLPGIRMHVCRVKALMPPPPAPESAPAGKRGRARSPSGADAEAPSGNDGAAPGAGVAPGAQVAL